MENREVICPNCGNVFWYWTINDFITCQQCKTKIPVEPMQEETPIQEVIDNGTGI
jgi:hypothetical protein